MNGTSPLLLAQGREGESEYAYMDVTVLLAKGS